MTNPALFVLSMRDCSQFQASVVPIQTLQSGQKLLRLKAKITQAPSKKIGEFSALITPASLRAIFAIMWTSYELET